MDLLIAPQSFGNAASYPGQHERLGDGEIQELLYQEDGRLLTILLLIVELIRYLKPSHLADVLG